MQKYITYAAYAKTYNICNICKKYKNMQKYAQSYHIWTLAYICAICAGPGRPAKTEPGGLHIFNVFVFISGICRKMRWCAYI